jgi:plastocyanin
MKPFLMKSWRRLRWLIPAGLLLATTACGKTPETTEQARGVLSGVNIVLAMTVVLVVVAGGLLIGAFGFDRFVRSRKRLAEAPAEPEEEGDEVVAGITVGRAGVPRWLYAFYVLIPLFAMLYVFTNIPIEAGEGGGAEPTATPQGPCTECTIVASGIAFDLDEIIAPAATDITVTFDNQDTGVPHDFTVWESEAAATAGGDAGKIATSGTINGGVSKDVTFNSDGAGSYYFNCTIHPPSMNGTFEVVES